jgi:tRNA (cmo5U34)-methyltransferase
MSPRGSHWKTAAAVEMFLKGRRGAIPAAALQLEIIGVLIDAWRPAPARVLDLGCGDGILGRMVLERFPETRVWFADFSGPMLKAAREKLAGDARARVVKADFGSKKWVRAVGDGPPFDVVVSGFAIHHQPHGRKRALYREIYDLLAPGGLFLNLDHVQSPTAEIEEVFTGYFVDHLFRFGRSSGSARSRGEIETEYRTRPDKKENVLAPLDEQCRWLREIGFADTDCYFRVLELALFGGRKTGG